MFDKLIESDSIHADFKPRRKFFMVSSVFVGILFLSAVMFSLYAQDLDLGTDNFEISTMLAPVVPDMPEPKLPREKTQSQQSSTTDQQKPEPASRQALIAAIDQTQIAPTTISTTPNIGRSIPKFGAFELNPNGPEKNGGGPVGPGPSESGTSAAAAGRAEVAEVIKAVEPPPIVKKETKPPPPKSEGVINGKATYLPNPPYPKPAQMVGAGGIVNVQVTIDESGKVISSKAVSGHPLLRGTAESAAWKAKFSPTLLSKVPVKVTGVIVFNFRKG